MKLFRRDYEEIEGKCEAVTTHRLFMWAAVNTKTGEVEVSDVRCFDDELEPLTDYWEWRKFEMFEAV